MLMGGYYSHNCTKWENCEVMSEEKKYHTFGKKQMKLKEILPLIRNSGYSNYDDGGKDVVLCPECEEWTHVKFNLHSGLLDLLGDLTVESLDADDSDIWLWIKTDEYNWFRIREEKNDGDMEGV